MTFASPGRLWILALVAALAVAYVVMQARRSQTATRFASADMLGKVAPHRPGRWRHALAAVLLAGLAVTALGFAEPTIREDVPRRSATVMLAIDVSDSMGATDVAPTRIAAAAVAARRFVDDAPDEIKIGLISVGPTPTVLVAPTKDRTGLEAALGNLRLRPGTALGEAIFTALAAIGPLPSATTSTKPSGSEPASPADERAARIVLLSDGTSTTGRSDAEGIAAAVEADVPVYTIAFGTSQATVQSQGQTVSVPVNRQALVAIAQGTGGAFFEAATPTQLRSVYDQIGVEVNLVAEDRIITDWFAGAALALLAIAVIAAMASTSRAVWV